MWRGARLSGRQMRAPNGDATIGVVSHSGDRSTAANQRFSPRRSADARSTISEEIGRKLASAKLEDLGRARRVKADAAWRWSLASHDTRSSACFTPSRSGASQRLIQLVRA